MAAVALSAVTPGDAFSYTTTIETAASQTYPKTVNYLLTGTAGSTAGTLVVYNLETHLFEQMASTTIVTEMNLEAAINVGFSLVTA